jgi:hypothetical protein
MIAMVWNNLATLSTFITSTTTSSINFRVLVYVVGSPNPSSYTILFPNSNSNGNPSVDFGLLGGTYSCIHLNSSKVGCVATLSICSSVTCRPSCVCCCCYKCCCQCCRCFKLVVVLI